MRPRRWGSLAASMQPHPDAADNRPLRHSSSNRQVLQNCNDCSGRYQGEEKVYFFARGDSHARFPPAFARPVRPGHDRGPGSCREHDSLAAQPGNGPTNRGAVESPGAGALLGPLVQGLLADRARRVLQARHRQGLGSELRAGEAERRRDAGHGPAVWRDVAADRRDHRAQRPAGFAGAEPALGQPIYRADEPRRRRLSRTESHARFGGGHGPRHRRDGRFDGDPHGCLVAGHGRRDQRQHAGQRAAGGRRAGRRSLRRILPPTSRGPSRRPAEPGNAAAGARIKRPSNTSQPRNINRPRKASRPRKANRPRKVSPRKAPRRRTAMPHRMPPRPPAAPPPAIRPLMETAPRRADRLRPRRSRRPLTRRRDPSGPIRPWPSNRPRKRLRRNRPCHNCRRAARRWASRGTAP